MNTLVLLPGMEGTGTLFGPLIEALGPAVDARVVVYPPEPLGYEELVALVRGQLPLDRPFVLLGESFSGPIAIRCAAANPPGLRGLVLCCTFARNPRPFLGILRPLVPLVTLGSLPDRLSGFFMTERTPAHDPLRAALAAAMATLPAAVWRARLRALLAVDARPELAQVRVPILYLRAAHDWLVGKAPAEEVRRICPQARIVSLPAPHLLLQTQAEAAAREIGSLLLQVQTSGAGLT